MTGPTSTTKRPAQERADQPSDSSTQANGRPDDERSPAGGGEAHELVRTQEEVAQRARRLVAGELLTGGLDGDDDRRRVDRLLEQARAGLLAELREQEQERARRQLQDAARSGEEAVAGVVQSVTAIVRSIVPPALVRPEELIEATFVLADQGLRVGRRLALTMSTSLRGLATAA